MIFQIDMWYKYRKQADVIGKHIASFKDEKGAIHLDKKVLEGYIQQITTILKECSDYMDKCGLTMGKPLWKYNVKQQATHPSNETFKFKDRMTPEAISLYGSNFMQDGFKECREG